MSNGTMCCAIGACCDTLAEQETALAKEIQAGMDSWDVGRDGLFSDATLAAKAVLAKFDLVPKGVGAAIVEAYRPLFKAPAQKAKGEL